MGLNLANRTPTTCVDTLIEQAAAAAGGAAAAGSIPPVRREDLLAGIVNRLEPMLARLAAEGFAPFEEEYCRHWLHSNQQVGQGVGPGRAMGRCGAALLAPPVPRPRPCRSRPTSVRASIAGTVWLSPDVCEPAKRGWRWYQAPASAAVLAHRQPPTEPLLPPTPHFYPHPFLPCRSSSRRVGCACQ